ncbi:phage tail protein [Ornithinibacillus xuwenensis]|uniref:Phage-related protein n=1 Tax=Ornithinibacillus xuwenensis TaxID=3144668 RepID=A0ABU9XC67_9BACI
MNERLNAIVGAKISEFRRKMAQVKATAMALPKNIVIEVEARVDKTQKRLDRLANSIRTLQTIGGNMAKGGLIALSPSAIPVLAGLTAALAMLGPMLAVMGGGALGLAAAFGVAGTGLAAFGTIAIPTMSRIAKAQNEIAKAEEKLAKADTAEERAKAQAELNAVYDKLSGSQQGFIKSLNSFKSFWGDFVTSFETPMLNIFSQGLTTLQKALKKLAPVFDKALSAMNTLMSDLDKSLSNPTVVKFIEFLAANVEPMMTKLGRAFGNIALGIMDMMMAFKPLMDMMADGFLEMSRGFAEWAKGLADSPGFQKFVSYVQENLPKVKNIFKDAFLGIIDLFAAFAPLAADMMSGLEDLMAKFRKWASNLESNDAFQGFIQYIRDNGPKVMTFFGEFIRLIANLVKAVAPLGAQMLELVNKFLIWFNGFIENNPWFQKFIGFMIVFGGVLQAVLPIIIGVISFFGGLFNTIKTKVWPWLQKLWTTIATKLLPFLGKIGGVIGKVLPWIAKIGGFFLRFLTGPIGWVIQIVILLVQVIVKYWDQIKSFTKKVFSAIADFFKSIWNGIKNFFTDTLVGLRDKAKEKMESMKNAIKDKMTGIWDGIKSIWDKITGFFDDINLFDSGKKIIQSAIDGIKSMIGKVGDVVGNITQKIRDFFPFSPPKEGPLRDLHKTDFSWAITKSINDSKASIQRAMNGMLQPTMALGFGGVSVGAPTSYDSREETFVSMQGVFDGAEITIREDADIERIAIALAERTKDSKRTRGIR